LILLTERRLIVPSVGYFRSALFRIAEPSVHAFHAECFGGSVLAETLEDGPLLLQKNIFNLAPMFVASFNCLIVNAEVRSLLEQMTSASFRPAKIAFAWSFPFDAGDQTYDRDDLYNDDGDLLIDLFAKRYQIAPPSLELFQVLMPDLSLIRYLPKYRQTHPDCRVIHLRENDEGRIPCECIVSHTLLAEVGLYHSRGFLCTPEVYNALSPYLRPFFFWSQTMRA
jgi:hypothetical protein